MMLAAELLLEDSLDELAGALDKLAGALEELTSSLEGAELLRLLGELSLAVRLEVSELDCSELDIAELETKELELCELDSGAKELAAEELIAALLLWLDDTAWLDSLLAKGSLLISLLASLLAADVLLAGVDELEFCGELSWLDESEKADDDGTTTGGLEEPTLLVTWLLVSLLADDENTEENTDEASDELSAADDTVPGAELLAAILAGDDWLVGVGAELTGCALLEATGALLPPPPPQA